MRTFFVFISLISFSAYGLELNASDECRSFLIHSQSNGFQSVWVNGASTSSTEFNQILETTFGQFEKKKTKQSKKENRDLAKDKFQIESYSANNDLQKVYIDLSASKDSSYATVYNDTTKSIHAMTFMNTLAADEFAQLEMPQANQDVFPNKLPLHYVVMQIDGQAQNNGNFIRCNCYWVNDMHEENTNNPWTCSFSTQKVVQEFFIPQN